MTVVLFAEAPEVNETQYSDRLCTRNVTNFESEKGPNWMGALH